jgi:hypothetical protein
MKIDVIIMFMQGIILSTNWVNMKRLMILSALCLLFSTLTFHAQTPADSMAIEKACRDYVEGWAEGDAGRVALGVSPELVKRTIGKDQDGASFTSEMSASMLAAATKRNRGGVNMRDQEPGKPFSLRVIIYDITGEYAMAKTVTTKYSFFDYCQLAKINGEWKVINVLWGYLPSQH